MMGVHEVLHCGFRVGSVAVFVLFVGNRGMGGIGFVSSYCRVDTRNLTGFPW